MGFRNPARTATATAVDTTTLGKGGVLVQSVDDPNSDGNTYGAVVFPDGIPGDSPSYIMGRPDYNPRSVANVLGGGLTLQGGVYAGRSGPSIQVKVESAADGTGSVSPVVRINSAGGRVLTDAPFDPVTTALVTFAAPFAAYPSAGTERLSVTLLASGACLVAGMVYNAGSVTASGRIGTVPANFAPRNAVALLQGYLNGGGSVRVDFGTDGSLTLIEPNLTAGNYLSLHAVCYPFAPHA